MERLDPRAVKRVSGPAWASLRGHIDRLNEMLLGVAPTARAELTTIYIKYTIDSKTGRKPFAVLWVKKSTELILGLALPQEVKAAVLHDSLEGYKYAGLTAFLVVTPNHDLPDELEEWVKIAFERSQQEATL